MPKIALSRALNILRAIFVGSFLAIIGVLFHNSFIPLGLIIALLESGIGFYYFAKYYKGRLVHLIAFFAWIFMVYRAASFGVSQEILIEGNLSGFIFFLGGMFGNFIGLVVAKRAK